MKNFYHIKSLIPATISINGEHNFISNLDIISNRNFYIAFFPINYEKYSPYALSSHDQNFGYCITKIPFKNNHYDIIFNPKHIKSASNEHIILNKKYMNTIFTIANSSETFINITSTKKSFSSTTELFQSVDFKTYNNIIIITADGREKASVGLTLGELARYMRQIGCVNAMNLDGGSSTVMFGAGQILNSPVNVGGIPVSNAVNVVME